MIRPWHGILALKIIWPNSYQQLSSSHTSSADNCLITMIITKTGAILGLRGTSPWCPEHDIIKVRRKPHQIWLLVDHPTDVGNKIGRISAVLSAVSTKAPPTPGAGQLNSHDPSIVKIEEPSTFLLPLVNDKKEHVYVRTSVRIAPQKEGIISDEFSGKRTRTTCCK